MEASEDTDDVLDVAHQTHHTLRDWRHRFIARPRAHHIPQQDARLHHLADDSSGSSGSSGGTPQRGALDRIPFAFDLHHVCQECPDRVRGLDSVRAAVAKNRRTWKSRAIILIQCGDGLCPPHFDTNAQSKIAIVTSSPASSPTHPHALDVVTYADGIVPPTYPTYTNESASSA